MIMTSKSVRDVLEGMLKRNTVTWRPNAVERARRFLRVVPKGQRQFEYWYLVHGKALEEFISKHKDTPVTWSVF